MDFREDNAVELYLSNEDILLIHLSRAHLTSNALREIAHILNSGIDWEQFVSGANFHGLCGLVYHHLTNYNLPIPSEVADTISQMKHDQVAVTRFLLKEIRKISSAISKIGLPTVNLKGPSIGHRVYPNDSIRSFGDIDLLVHVDDVRTTEECLYGLGYEHIALDLLKNEIKYLTMEELEVFRPGLLHRPMLVKATQSRFRSTVEIHPTNWRIGSVDFDALYESSVEFPSLGRGVRVLRMDDLVIHSAYHFYRHFRLAMLHDVSTSFGCFLPRNPGVLKYLSDIYACLRSYLSCNGNWLDLIHRSHVIGAKDIFLYGLFYVNLVYGKSTVPKWIIDRLKTPPIQVPLIDTSVQVNMPEELLTPDIQTLSRKIGPEEWLFQPENAWKQAIEAAKLWRMQNGAWATVIAKRITPSQLSNGMPESNAWGRTRELVLDPKAPDSSQFFLSHVSGGVWSKRNSLRAGAKMLWDHRNLYVRINVRAKSIKYVTEDLKEFGEGVVLYFSGTSHRASRIMRVRYAVCESDSIYPIPLPLFSSGACEDIDPSRLSATCYTSERGYCISLCIPWKCIHISMENGRSIGFDLEVIHRSQNMVLETVLAWSGGFMLSEVDPSVHGILTLIE